MSHDKPKVTIYDVADRANVAISTVSRVLNGSRDVSEPTRVRVQKAIEEMQFRPDRTAKTLAQRQTRSLAVAVPTFTTPFHVELLKGIRYRLQDFEIDLLLFDLGSKAPHRSLLQFLKRGAVDGLLLAGVPVADAIATELKALHAPVVLIGNRHEAFDAFHWDDGAGAQAAVAHLVERGHRRIGMIRAQTESTLQDRRIEGYRAALAAAGLTVDDDWIVAGETKKHAGFSEEAGYEAMKTLMERVPGLTAVFASSDVQAIGAWAAVRDAGRRVPDDVALVGYDDVKTSQYIGLSSVDQQMHEVGEEAAELLIERMVGPAPDAPLDKLIIPRLQVRLSSSRAVTEG